MENQTELDLNKSGFFHLHTMFSETENDDRQLHHWLQKQQHLLQLLPDHSPERCAIKNTIGLFMYVLQQNGTAEYFEEILQDTAGNRNLNTMANLIYIYKNMQSPKGDHLDELLTKLHEMENDNSPGCKLGMAKAMCERGYYTAFHVTDEIHDVDQAKAAVKFFEEGTKLGHLSGMDPRDINIWQYYLFRAIKFLFKNKAVSGEDICEEFTKLVDTFQDFYTSAGEENNFYKSRALMDMAVTFTLQREAIAKLDNFDVIFQDQSFMREIWDDVFEAGDLAMTMSPYDHNIPRKIARIYTCFETYDKTEEYLEMSLSLESNLNLGALLAKMKLHSNLAKKYDLENQKHLSKEQLHLAYSCGKEIENICMSTAAVAEMLRVCYNLSVDRQRRPWGVIQANRHYLEEAIQLGERAIGMKRSEKLPRIFSLYAQCQWLNNNKQKAVQYMHKAIQLDRSDHSGNLYFILNYHSNMFHEERTSHTILYEIADVLELAYAKFTSESLAKTFAKFASSGLALKNRLIMQVLDELGSRPSTESTEALRFFCTAVVQNECRDARMRNYCQEKIQD